MCFALFMCSSEILLFGLIFFVLFAYTFLYYSKNLPDIEEIPQEALEEPSGNIEAS